MNPKAYSLHMGLNHVDPEHYQGLQDLSCCINDATRFHEIATDLKFEKRELLRNEEVTSAKFLNLLKDWSAELTSGDMLWITYSGHGGQKPDLNSDETDAWDET